MDAKSLLPKTTVGPWSLSGLKTMRGNETPCFDATLLLHGKPFAFVHNDGRGGQTDFRNLMTGEFNAALAATVTEWARANRPALSAPGLAGDGSAFVMAENAETIVIGLVEAHGELRCLKQDAKRMLLCWVPGDDADSFRTFKRKVGGKPAPPDASMRSAVLAKHPDAVIMNDAILEA